jgi:hypothetical protein
MTLSAQIDTGLYVQEFPLLAKNLVIPAQAGDPISVRKELPLLAKSFVIPAQAGIQALLAKRFPCWQRVSSFRRKPESSVVQPPLQPQQACCIARCAVRIQPRF